VATLAGRPSDEELRTLVDPERAPPYLTLDDDGTILTARPRPWPVALYWASMSLPLLGWSAALVWKWDELLGSPHPFERAFSAVMTIGMLAAAVLGRVAFGWLARRHTRTDPFFILDRAAGTLTLLRAGVTVRRGDVEEVIEVHGYHRVADAEGSSADYLREVSVLARGQAGLLVRYPVVVAGHAKPVGRVAAELAEVFGIPRRKMVESFFGRSWRQTTD
jgi:hypothetical protein